MRRMIKAVIFDLWETLIDWDREAATNMLQAVAGRSGLEPDEFHRRWNAQDNRATSARSATRCAASALPRRRSRTSARCGSSTSARALVPRAGVVETLRTLRERGLLVGLITVCSEDVEVVLPETELAGLFDAEVFSSPFGSRSPTRGSTCTAASCSGSSRTRRCSSATARTTSSTGARRVGMEAILIHRPARSRCGPGCEDWDGPR